MQYNHQENDNVKWRINIIHERTPFKLTKSIYQSSIIYYDMSEIIQKYMVSVLKMKI